MFKLLEHNNKTHKLFLINKLLKDRKVEDKLFIAIVYTSQLDVNVSYLVEI
jgi:hypothetical protein